MSRDHRKLRVFVAADAVVLKLYRLKGFPASELFGLRSQLLRASVSVPCNIVEGSARRSAREYLNFLNVACGSGAEASYLLDLSHRLGFVSDGDYAPLCKEYEEINSGLRSLIEALEEREASGKRHRRCQAQSLEPRA